MSDLFAEPRGATPLDAEERDGLLQSWITTRADLNEAEQANNDDAAAWLRRRRDPEILTEGFIFELHKRMFGEVWAWAGTTRRSDKNIGVDWQHIPVELGGRLREARYWIENGVYGPDQIAVRLHHGLVFVHPFPNGNGRHARLVGDLLAEQMGARPFSWGSGSLMSDGEIRDTYISALRLADRHEFGPLLEFARS